MTELKPLPTYRLDELNHPGAVWAGPTLKYLPVTVGAVENLATHLFAAGVLDAADLKDAEAALRGALGLTDCGHTWPGCLLLHGGHECIRKGGHAEHRCYCGATEPVSRPAPRP